MLQKQANARVPVVAKPSAGYPDNANEVARKQFAEKVNKNFMSNLLCLFVVRLAVFCAIKSWYIILIASDFFFCNEF